MDVLIDRLNDWSEPVFNGLVIPFFGAIALVLDRAFFFVHHLPPGPSVILVAVIGAVMVFAFERIMGCTRSRLLAGRFSEHMKRVGAAGNLALTAETAMIRKGVRDSADEVYNDLVMHQFFLFGMTWFLPMVALLVWLERAVFPPERLEALTGSPFVLPGLEMGLPFFYLVVFNAALIVIRVFVFALGKRARG